MRTSYSPNNSEAFYLMHWFAKTTRSEGGGGGTLTNKISLQLLTYMITEMVKHHSNSIERQHWWNLIQNNFPIVVERFVQMICQQMCEQMAVQTLACFSSSSSSSSSL